MKRFILHIGHSKCASSTVQSFLSFNPVMPTKRGDGSVLRYVAVEADGTLRWGDALSDHAAQFPHRYANSAPAFLSDKRLFQSAMDQIQRIGGPDDTIVASCEGWGNAGFVTSEVAANIASLAVKADIVLMTRPPADWVNAAWWQWGLWSNEDPQTALAGFQSVDFMQSLDQWRDSPNIGRVGVFDISQGPLDCLLDFADAQMSDPVEFEPVNVATDYDLLRHLARNRAYYQQADPWPTVEFRLNSLARFDRKPLPFILDRDATRSLISRGQRHNEALLGLIEAEGRVLAHDVRRKYLDPAAYDHLTDDAPIGGFDADYSDQFVSKLVGTILSLGAELDTKENLWLAAGSFDPDLYLALNPDVRRAGLNPYEHFMRFGLHERRRWR